MSLLFRRSDSPNLLRLRMQPGLLMAAPDGQLVPVWGGADIPAPRRLATLCYTALLWRTDVQFNHPHAVRLAEEELCRQAQDATLATRPVDSIVVAIPPQCSAQTIVFIRSHCLHLAPLYFVYGPWPVVNPYPR